MRQRLTTAVVDEDPVRRAALGSALRRDGLEILAECSTPALLHAAVHDRQLDAVVLGGDVEEAQLATLGEFCAGAHVVIVGPIDRRRLITEMVARGVDSFVPEADVERRLGPAVRSVCSGQLSLPQELRDSVSGPSLSTREKQILGMVVIGFGNGDIARKLHITESTVKSHLSSAFKKLGVRSRNEAATLILDPERGLGTGILAISDDHAAVRPTATPA
jgi:DNA-binding NarL/FixJ family response regulator